MQQYGNLIKRNKQKNKKQNNVIGSTLKDADDATDDDDDDDKTNWIEGRHNLHISGFDGSGSNGRKGAMREVRPHVRTAT